MVRPPQRRSPNSATPEPDWPRLHPFDYPWPAVTVPSLVDRRGVRALAAESAPPGDDSPQPAAGVPSTSEVAADRLDDVVAELISEPGRCWVLAIGSNRSPDVLTVKLAGTTGAALMLPVRVAGLGVGHSAHVSRRGYLPAAPFDDPGGAADATVLSLTAEQVAALDATEPNYDRVVLDPDRYRLSPWPPLGERPHTPTCPDPGSGERSGRVWVYASRRRLLADGPGVLRLTSQRDLQSRLLEHPPLQRLLPAAPAPSLCDLLSEDQMRSAVTELLPLTLGTRPAGLPSHSD